MTADQVLSHVLDAGGRIIPDPVRPRLLVPPALKPLVAKHREALRVLVLRPPPNVTDPPELAAALTKLEAEIRSGQIGSAPILVRGKPLAHWLPLDEVARWLRRATP